MSLNLQCKPKIFIKNQDVNVESFDINFQGKNRINSCNLKINHNLVDWSRLFNEEVKIYLNENDGKPIFRGFIKQVVPSDTNLNITVYDPRYLLTSKEGIPINITDKDNYDGYTVSQFLIDYIDKYVNTDKIYIGTDYISDTVISTLMGSLRGFQDDLYSIVQRALEKSIDDTDIDNLVGYIIDVVDDGTKAQLIIQKEKLLSSVPSLTLSEVDGIENIMYTKRMPPSYSTHFTNDGRSGSYQHGNMPYGRINESSKGNFENPADATYASMISVLQQQDNVAEIKATINRGYDVNLGSIVLLNVDDFNIKGKHRVTTKRLSYSKNSMKCVLGLNTKPVTLIGYI